MTEEIKLQTNNLVSNKVKLDNLFKRARPLKQYQSLSDEELMGLIIEKESLKTDESSIEELDIEDMFIDKQEKKEAKKLLRKYLTTYTIETISEKNTLKQLVFLEIFNIRLQRELNKYHEQDQPSPVKTVEALHSNLTQISILKEKIGLSTDKKGKNLNEGYAILSTLFKKWKIWREENQGSRSCNCPHCGKMIMLKIRTEAWEAQKHPYFKDRILANDHLMDLYKREKITQHDVARILGTSIDYISWLVKKIYFKEFGIVNKVNEEDEVSKNEEILLPSQTLNIEEPILNN
jgi:DNA-directed RNA polymerase subunit RPC12/RpoP